MGSAIAPASATTTAADRIDGLVLALARHWVAVLAGYGLTVLGLALLAPVIASQWSGTAARFIYLPYRLICHQKEHRSFHILGEKMAFCERDTAIVTAAVVIILLLASLHRAGHMPSIPFWGWVLLALPMVADGATQLLGFRESTAVLRVLTGALFSIGGGLFLYRHLSRGFGDLANEIASRRGKTALTEGSNE